jgi:cytochrome c peroxidase
MDVVMAFDAGSADPRSARIGGWAVAQDPVGLAIDADRRRALVWSQQKRSIDFIQLDAAADSNPGTDRLELSRKARYEKAELALGRALFHRIGDRRIAADGRGCASCHVDGRDDGLTWSTPAGPRQTPALAGRLRDTAPFGWDGQGSDLTRHMSETFVRLQGSGLSERELAALRAYVESLPLPHRAESERSDERARGRRIFFSAQTGCAACHSGASFSDGQLHDVGSRTAADKDGRFNTPSLLGVGATAPYFHDGRFASLEQMLLATSGRMGKTRHLSRTELSALVAYLESL